MGEIHSCEFVLRLLSRFFLTLNSTLTSIYVQLNLYLPIFVASPRVLPLPPLVRVEAGGEEVDQFEAAQDAEAHAQAHDAAKVG